MIKQTRSSLPQENQSKQEEHMWRKIHRRTTGLPAQSSGTVIGAGGTAIDRSDERRSSAPSCFGETTAKCDQECRARGRNRKAGELSHPAPLIRHAPARRRL